MVNVLKENIEYHIIKRIGQVRDSRRYQKSRKNEQKHHISCMGNVGY